jgi:hypothetical protein
MHDDTWDEDGTRNEDGKARAWLDQRDRRMWRAPCPRPSRRPRRRARGGGARERLQRRLGFGRRGGRAGLERTIVLPAAGTPIATFTANMTAGALAGVTGQLKVTSGSVALPRFTASFGESLNAALGSLGMGVAFCPTGDFAALVEPNYPQICLYDVEHKTVVEVDESGTVAAGATTVGIGIEAVTRIGNTNGLAAEIVAQLEGWCRA